LATLLVQMSISLDGFIEGPGSDLEWFAGDEHFDHILTTTLRGISGMVFGRRAHAHGAAYWPTAGETAETAEVAEQIELMNNLPKYVLAHGEIETSWTNCRAIDLNALARLKAEATRPLVLFAGARAARSAWEAGHVDQLRLIQFPVLLGGGTPLLAPAGQRCVLTPVERQIFEAGGPVVTRYLVG
jgi:dihydrofolate reductase